MRTGNGRESAWRTWVKVIVVTAVEAVAVYLWLRLDHHGDPWLGLMVLGVGEVAETVFFTLGTAKGVCDRWSRLEFPAADGGHFRRVKRTVDAAGTVEIVIWLLWLFIAEQVGQPVAASVLLVLMYVKHHVEIAAVLDTRIRAGLFERRNASASVMEVAGAVACLALIRDGHLVRAAIVLFVGLLIEHAIQIDTLHWEIKSRDIRLPRDRRWAPADRWWELKRYLFTHFPVVWRLLQRKPLEQRVNRYLINKAIAIVPPRPNPLSTMVPYTSWASLTDRRYSGRHLPPVPEGAATPATTPDGPPSAAEVAELFQRGRTMLECPKSTVLFAFFAQWFTDGFLRTKRDPPATTRDGPPSAAALADLFQRGSTMRECPKSTVLFAFFAQRFRDGFLRKKRDPPGGGVRDTSMNESTHEIDLSQLYGFTDEATRQLRAHDGLLKYQTINDEEFPPYYCVGGKPLDEFDALFKPLRFDALPASTRNQLFASGTDVTNLGVAAFNTLFLREHNRIARRLSSENPTWDDDRVFQTARNVLTVVLIRIVLEEYINHITPQIFQFRLPLESFPNEPWHRQNWMAIEFNLLYRWHSLVPSIFYLNGKALQLKQLLAETDPLTSLGLGPLMAAASSQPAGRIGLSNTDSELVRTADVPSIEQARAARLASFNDYRRLCRLLPAADFADISADKRTARKLEDLYGNVENVEFYVGLFAEDIRPNSVLPPLMTMMVAFDAFSQALTNPLLAPRVYNEQTFSSSGMEIIRQTSTVSDLVRRNVPCGPDEYWVSFKRRDAPPTHGRVPARPGPGSARPPTAQPRARRQPPERNSPGSHRRARYEGIRMREFLRPVIAVHPKPADPSTARYVRSYLIMRTVAGALGIALPFMLVLVDGLWLDSSPFLRTSLSAYYYSGARELFVGVLSAIGVFLITYKVAEINLDNTLSLLAGLAILIVVLFPTARPNDVFGLTPLQDRLGESVVAGIHFTAAGTFILSLAVLSYYFGKREGARKRPAGERSPRFWRTYHWICAGIIMAALAWSAVTELSGWGPSQSLLYGEAVAVWAFGASWLWKGLELDMLCGDLS